MYEVLKVDFEGEDCVFTYPSRSPLSCWRNSLLSFDILKLKFDLIGGELWFVKVNVLKWERKFFYTRVGSAQETLPAGVYLQK